MSKLKGMRFATAVVERHKRRRTRVVGTFPDGKSALMLAAARLKYVADSEWGSRRYLDASLLKEQPCRRLAKSAKTVDDAPQPYCSFRRCLISLAISGKPAWTRTCAKARSFAKLLSIMLTKSVRKSRNSDFVK